MKAGTICGTWTRSLAVVLVVLVGLVSASPGAFAAQGKGLVDDTTYVLETTGDEVTWDDPWEFDDDISETGDGYEIVALNAELSSLLISVLPNGLDIEEARDIVLDEFAAGTDEFATIDRGAYDNISYSLDLANVDGTDLGVFTLFRRGSGSTPTFAYIFISSIQGFGDGFASSQERIAIDGDPIFKGVDGDGLQTQLEQNRGSAPDPDEDTPEPDDAETPQADDPETPEGDDGGSSTEEPDDGNIVVDLKDQTPDADPDDDSDNAAGGDDDIDEEFIDLGVVSQGEYVSPQFGTEISWSREWVINENVDEPVVSDEEGNLDLLVLSDDTNTYLSIQLQEAGRVRPSDLVELWTSDDFLSRSDDSGTEPDKVVLEDSGQEIGAVVVVAELEDGTRIVVYREVQLLDDGDTLAIIQCFQTVAAAEDGISSAQDSVEVDGEPVLAFFDVEDVVDALG